MSAVERFISYSTTVDDLSEAWTFVMEHIDSVGWPPSVSIKPIWMYAGTPSDPDPESVQRFEVSVAGGTAMDDER